MTEKTSYEQARDELAAIVAELEAGNLTLDESIARWERGEYLTRLCRSFLEGARTRVEAALAAADATSASADSPSEDGAAVP